MYNLSFKERETKCPSDAVVGCSQADHYVRLLGEGQVPLRGLAGSRPLPAALTARSKQRAIRRNFFCRGHEPRHRNLIAVSPWGVLLHSRTIGNLLCEQS